MKLSVASSFLAFLAVAFADRVSFDPVYDNANQSLATVSCSTGSNGLLTRNFTTFSSIPTFPFIGGASAIASFNSPACGTCWSLTFNGTTIKMTAIDSAASGFNLGETAMNNLTNGQAVQLGVVQATSQQLNASECGL